MEKARYEAWCNAIAEVNDWTFGYYKKGLDCFRTKQNHFRAFVKRTHGNMIRVQIEPLKESLSALGPEGIELQHKIDAAAYHLAPSNPIEKTIKAQAKTIAGFANHRLSLLAAADDLRARVIQRKEGVLGDIMAAYPSLEAISETALATEDKSIKIGISEGAKKATLSITADMVDILSLLHEVKSYYKAKEKKGRNKK